jgi:L-amino acid N-acyltransferase YncA
MSRRPSDVARPPAVAVPVRAPVIVRVADPDRDAAAVAEIYRPSVEGSVTSFELIPPDGEEMARRIRAVLPRTPWLVAVATPDRPSSGTGTVPALAPDRPADGSVVGYAYATRHRERPAYRWSVETSVYVREGWQGRGIGRALYDALFAVLRVLGFANAFAGVTLPNAASVALHEAMGMRPVGVYQRSGWKSGAWHDTAWFGLRLADPALTSTGEPEEPRTLLDLGPEELAKALTKRAG